MKHAHEIELGQLLELISRIAAGRTGRSNIRALTRVLQTIDESIDGLPEDVEDLLFDLDSDLGLYEPSRLAREWGPIDAPVFGRRELVRKAQAYGKKLRTALDRSEA